MQILNVEIINSHFQNYSISDKATLFEVSNHATLYIKNSTFINNYVSSFGSIIYLESNGDIELNNVVFESNSGKNENNNHLINARDSSGSVSDCMFNNHTEMQSLTKVNNSIFTISGSIFEDNDVAMNIINIKSSSQLLSSVNKC